MRSIRGSPLVTQHIAGKSNRLGDILLRLFGYEAKWYHINDTDFLTFFNQTFPLPSQNSWTGFRFTSAVSTKVMQEKLTRGLSMGKWRRLPKIGRRFGGSGRPIANMSKCLHTWTAVTSKPSPGLPQCLEGTSKRTNGAGWSALDSSALVVGESTRQLLWTQAANPSTN